MSHQWRENEIAGINGIMASYQQNWQYGGGKRQRKAAYGGENNQTGVMAALASAN
jgi:hypothetical protein